MTILSIIFWVLIVLLCASALGLITGAYAVHVGTGIIIALFVIIGLKIFRTPLQ